MKVWNSMQKDLKDNQIILIIMIVWTILATPIFEIATLAEVAEIYGVLALFFRLDLGSPDLSPLKSTSQKLLPNHYIKGLVVFVPVLVLGGVLPILGEFDLEELSLFTWALYYLGLVATIGLMMHLKILLNLNWETLFRRYWEPKQWLIWIELLGLMVVYLVFKWAWEDLVYLDPQFPFAPGPLDAFLRSIPFSELFFAGCFVTLVLVVWAKVQR